MGPLPLATPTGGIDTLAELSPSGERGGGGGGGKRGVGGRDRGRGGGRCVGGGGGQQMGMITCNGSVKNAGMFPIG